MLRFEMSGQRFEFDTAKKITAGEFFVIDEILGVKVDAFLEAVAAGLTGERSLSSVVKEFCVVAFLAQRRAGGRRSWAEFAETVEPETIRLIPDQPPVTVGVDPNLGQQVPAPEPLSPTLAALGMPEPPAGAHEAGQAAVPEMYRAPLA